ncbi:hypothetical protein HYALB_00012143 [Hymenoscyphus albidus]|uniref:Mid2 domain-containing protein n=1 Tax=Hymenoscyphus albidus TaxID=595503 RepID=A0A9N9LKZ7_9HELO|nr:hypothetical protein HYALB_00012143 [Hymenoscyphus albidus]
MTRYIVPLILFILSSTTALDQCFYPDGKTVDPQHVPCNQTAGIATNTFSSCCSRPDACTTSGLCLGSAGWVYRGSCTDASWASPNCAKQFPKCNTHPDGTLYTSYAVLKTCAARSAMWAPEYCCGENGVENPDCCQNNFTLGITGTAYQPGNDVVMARRLASLTSGAAATVTATLGPTSTAGLTASSESSGMDLGTKVGLGVGIPLGVLVLGALALMFWREKRKNAYKGVDTSPSSPMAVAPGPYEAASQHGRANSSITGYTVTPQQEYSSPIQQGHHKVHEVPAAAHNTYEMPSSQN